MLKLLTFGVFSQRSTHARLAWGPSSALALLIVFSIAARLLVSAILPLHQDEAYHYLFTKHLALAYFDHPPMVMWIAWLGVKLCGGIVNPLTVRFGFILLMAGSLWVTARLTARWFGDWAGVYAATLLAVSGYHGSAGGMVYPESPLLFFTLLTIWAASAAVNADTLRPWVWVGLAFGGAMLSKYFAVFLPAGVLLYLIVTPDRRKLLLRAGPYLAVAIGFAVFSPVIVWNATHEWASFAFQGERGTVWHFDLGFFFNRLITSIFWLFPWVCAVLLAGFFGILRRFRTAQPAEQFFACMALVPLTAFTALSLVSPVLPHWPLYGYLPLLPLGGAQLAAWSHTHLRAVRRGMVAAMAFAGITAVVVVMQTRTGFLPLQTDPSAEIGCWDQVAEGLVKRDLLNRPNTFVFTSKWCDSAQLEFALREQHTPVACYYYGDSRGYAFWSRPEDYLGKDAIYVAASGDAVDAELFKLFFRKVEKIAEFPLTRGGRHYGTTSVYLCIDQFDSFPFDDRKWTPKVGVNGANGDGVRN